MMCVQTWLRFQKKASNVSNVHSIIINGLLAPRVEIGSNSSKQIYIL